MDEAARKDAMDKLVPALEPEEYGKMPASHYRNSQRVTSATVDTDTVGGDASERPSSKSAQETPQKPVRGPILIRDKYEGVDSDDETDEEMEDEEDEEDAPQVVGDVEIDMGEEEDEFVEFARGALGITDEMWADIVRDRRARGGKMSCTIHLH
jgi:hypothetical protein